MNSDGVATVAARASGSWTLFRRAAIAPDTASPKSRPISLTVPAFGSRVAQESRRMIALERPHRSASPWHDGVALRLVQSRIGGTPRGG